MKSRYSAMALLILGILLGGVVDKASAQVDVLSITITKPDSGKVLGIDSTIVVEVVASVPVSQSPVLEAWLYHVPTVTNTSTGTITSVPYGVADSTQLGWKYGQIGNSTTTRIARSSRTEDGTVAAVAAPTVVFSGFGTASAAVVGMSVAANRGTHASRAVPYTIKRSGVANQSASASTNTTAGSFYGNDDSADNELDSLAVTDDADSVVVSEVTVSGQARAKFTWYYSVNEAVGEWGDSISVAAQFGNGTAGALTRGSARLARDSASGFTGTTKMFGLDGNRPDNPTDPGTASNMQFDYSTTSAGGTGQTATGDTIALKGLTSSPVQTVRVDASAAPNRSVLGIGDTIVVTYPISSTQATALFATNPFTKLVGKVKIKGTLFDASYYGTPDHLKTVKTLAAADGFNWPATVPSLTDTIAVYLQDTAGNLSASNANFGIPQGITQAVTFILDTTAPGIDNTAGDTLFPVSNDTISDGTNNGAATVAYANDINPMVWKLAEPLDSLVIAFAGPTNASIGVENNGGSASSATSTAEAANGLAASVKRQLNFTLRGTRGIGVAAASKTLSTSDSGAATVYSTTNNPVSYTPSTAADSILKTGVYTLTFTPYDLAKNAGTSLSRTNVYVDVDDITLSRLFPTDASGLDTIDESTAQVVFKLSEPADSVLISYKSISGPDYDSGQRIRTRRLSGSSLTNTTSEQTLLVDSLKSGTKYVLTVLARDLAGNFTRSTPDTFLYDTAFVVPVIAKFSISVSAAKKGLGGTFLASDTLTVNLSALTSKDKAAVTYKTSGAILKIRGKSGTGPGVKLVSGTGATDGGNGRIVLNGDDWVTGTRSVIIQDTTSVDTMTISIVDSTNVASIYSGSLDSVIVVQPATYSKIWVSAPDTVTQGTPFWVSLKLVDTYGNTRVKDNRYVQVAANKLGVDAPFEAAGVYLEKGVGGFWATSESFTGNDLVFRVRDVIQKTSTAPGASATDVGDNYNHGKSDSILVLAAGDSGGDELDAPGDPVAADYMGADGLGDQGGFILLSFAPSADHETLTAYRIWREIVVDHDLDATGALVELAEPTSKYIPWAKVDAVPGLDGAVHVVVATLDGIATNWGVSAERGRETTNKQSFITAAVSPMERMAQNLMKSKQAATVKRAPVFASLTPEALAFARNGIAPRMKSTLPVVVQSAKVYTKEPVRAIDNIAPEAISSLRAMDTPGDAGGSITVSWVKSASDAKLPRMIASAVGPTTSDMVDGVKGYNVYRKSGRGDYTLVGKTNAGETSFVDATVFNGERYAYKVSAFDEDNEASASVERTAMAIRNRVFDRTGALVLGLFGVDNKVGFDDFFVLADRFGLAAGDEGFDSAFDLRADNRIDFDDFFVFADNFGRGIEGSAKVVPVLAGLNSDARLELNAGSTLPRIGEELMVAVDLANFVEVKGYGFSVNYDPTVLEFVRVANEGNLLGSGALAEARGVANAADGTVAIAAYGQTATQGNLGVSLVFRTKAEIENSYIDLTEAQLQDGSYGLNQVASLGSVQVQTRPEIFALADNYPNPFNPETTLKYQLPEAADVKLEVYNVVGQVVRTLVADHQNAGRYVVQWDATNDNGQPLSSGIYFYHIQAGDFQKTKKMLLLK